MRSKNLPPFPGMIADENFSDYRDTDDVSSRSRLSNQESTPAFTELLSSLGADLKIWAREESNLAKAEAGEKLHQAKQGILHLAAGLLLTISALGFFVIMTALAIALGLQKAGLSMQTAYLASVAILCLVTVLAGSWGLKKAKRKLSADNLWPEKTADSLKESTKWVREKIQ